MKTLSLWRWRQLSLALSGMLAFACAEPIEDIDRTQPNKIRKSAFDGEWYFRQTTVDINGTGFSSFIAYEGDGERVTFQITERALIARRAHEDVLGIDAPANNIPPEFEDIEGFDKGDGSPVAAFSILTHFDVQRAYNAATGEQSNVIMENIPLPHNLLVTQFKFSWQGLGSMSCLDGFRPRPTLL